MPKTVEMIVSLKVPDTTAITALQTLSALGFSKIKDAKRADYYSFLIDDNLNDFENAICKVDILVNANKHSYEFSIKKDNNIKILVRNSDDDGESLLSTLKNRLGFKNIKKIQKSVLWSLMVDANKNEAKKIADNAAKQLLVNENYQEYEIIANN